MPITGTLRPASICSQSPLRRPEAHHDPELPFASILESVQCECVVEYLRDFSSGLISALTAGSGVPATVFVKHAYLGQLLPRLASTAQILLPPPHPRQWKPDLDVTAFWVEHAPDLVQHLENAESL